MEGKGQRHEGGRNKRRQVTEPELGAGKLWSGSTAGGGTGLGRLVLGQVSALLLICWEGRGAWVVGQLEARVLGSPSHLATWPPPRPILIFLLNCLIRLNQWEILLLLCQMYNFHLPAAGLEDQSSPLGCLSV